MSENTEAKKDTVERALWALKVGEMSQLFETDQGIMCVKLHAVVPPDPNAKISTARNCRSRFNGCGRRGPTNFFP